MGPVQSGARAGLPAATDFPVLTIEKTRFGDTDMFGHINNAVVSTFLEAGRSELLRYGGVRVEAPDCRFVLVRAEIDFRGELFWPGEVVVGSRVAAIGRSSLTIEQAVFQHGVARVVGRSTMVHVNAALKASQELTPAARAHFALLGAAAI
jgi:acyl-CoA thioester hydrolase